MSSSIRHSASVGPSHPPLGTSESSTVASSRTSASLGGHSLAQVNSDSQRAIGKEALGIAREKFKITTTSSWWSGTKITITAQQQITGTSIPTFQGTKENAKELLDFFNLPKQQGTLVLKSLTTGGEIQLQYKKFWFTPSSTQKQQAASYINSLLKKAFEDVPASMKEKTAPNFINYLQQPSTSIDVENLKKTISLVKQGIKDAGKALTTPLQQQTIPQSNSLAVSLQLPALTTPLDFLKLQGVTIETTTLGEGGFGKVYAAKANGTEYVYKEENKGRPLDSSDLNGKFWRDGDIAAARLKDLPHFAKATGFILEIKPPGTSSAKWYIPANETKQFGTERFPPGTKVTLVAQLMEKAPGKELFHHLNDHLQSGSFNPLEHFDTIADQLFSFLEKSFARNLIHRDLKPENFMYDADPQSPTYKTGTVIDFGLGGVYRKEEKQALIKTTTAHDQKNPFQSRRAAGTLDYLAPGVGKGLYGAEVDFHSAGAMLVCLLSPRGFNSATTHFITPPNRVILSKIPTSTQDYLTLLGEESDLAKKLEEHPAMRQTIDLFFGVASTTPEKRKEALQALRSHMTEQKKTLVPPSSHSIPTAMTSAEAASLYS